MQEKERIFVTGPPGVGKSTYAKNIANQKRLRLYQLDRIRYPHGAGKASPIKNRLSEDIFTEAVKKIVSKESWIIEGTLKNKQDIVFPRSTKIIVLTAPRLVCTYRTLKRSIKRVFKIEKQGVFNELNGLFSKNSRVIWAWKDYPRYIKQIDDALENTSHNAKIIRRRL